MSTELQLAFPEAAGCCAQTLRYRLTSLLESDLDFATGFRESAGSAEVLGAACLAASG